MHALPAAINIYNKYREEGVRVLGLATAFEDFDKNTLENLQLLADLVKNQSEPNSDDITKLILPQIPDFESKPKEYQDQIRAQVLEYLSSKEYSAETFERFALRGTPSTILVDRKGILQDVSFGQTDHIEPLIKKLLDDD